MMTMGVVRSGDGFENGNILAYIPAKKYNSAHLSKVRQVFVAGMFTGRSQMYSYIQSPLISGTGGVIGNFNDRQ